MEAWDGTRAFPAPWGRDSGPRSPPLDGHRLFGDGTDNPTFEEAPLASSLGHLLRP